MVNVCMVGHGMMGIWHSDALRRVPDAQLHTVVGRRKDPAKEARQPAAGRKPSSTEDFATRYGYKKWTTDLDEALADPDVDVVIIAGPSETHAEMAIKSLDAGKHTLVEIPIAMNLADSERVVAIAKEKGLTLGLSHPMRFRSEHGDVAARIAAGREHLYHTHGRFYIYRLHNVGATGLQRTWTDNILWHHSTHLVDIGLWLACGGDMSTADERVRNVHGFYPAIEPRTGIPMEIAIHVETRDNQSIMVTGSYYASWRIYDVLTTTDRDMYLVDELSSTLQAKDETRPIPSEQENAELIAPDFVRALVEGREPLVPGWSVLPTMRVLHRVQEEWDAKYGKQLLPGRPTM
ncbi:MAG TPA: Gfo/Idh/MocA family oxidoreductase [Actinoplanes sp.]|jgi:2-hydroxy-4-carboxymuconate semialdehyde hemiacetal dehydrogenase